MVFIRFDGTRSYLISYPSQDSGSLHERCVSESKFGVCHEVFGDARCETLKGDA